MNFTDTLQTAASLIAVIGSITAIVFSIYRAGPERRKTNEESIKADADASLTYGDLAEKTAKRLNAAESEIEQLKKTVKEMQTNQDKLSRYISYQSGIIDRLIAQLVSHDISPVTRPVTLEEYK